MLDSIHKQGYYISSCSLIDFGGFFSTKIAAKIHQNSSVTFLRPGVWVATVTNQRIFMSEKIINITVLNGFVSFLFYFAVNI